MPTENATQPLWALVELMGHQRMAGRIEEVELAGAGFLRIDVPAAEGPEFGLTRFVSPQAIYAINPMDETLAREMARAIDHEPVSPFELTQFSERIRQTIREEQRNQTNGDDEVEMPTEV